MLTPHQQGTQQCSLHINKVLSNAHSTSTRYSALLTPQPFAYKTTHIWYSGIGTIVAVAALTATLFNPKIKYS